MDSLKYGLQIKMELLKRLLVNSKKIFLSSQNHNTTKRVFFKIVDVNKKNQYTLQCANSKSIFYANILEIVLDTDILHRLHPLQSCFIGLEYAKYIKNNKKNFKKYWRTPTASSKITENEEILQLKYQNRKGDICYFDKYTNEEFIISPKDLAFSNNLIKKFHAEQAFYIGVCAGFQIHNHSENIFYLNAYKNKPSEK